MSIPFFLVLMAACCCYAFARGAAPEKIAATLQIAAFGLTLLVRRVIDVAGFQGVGVGSAIVDGLLLLALVTLAWRSTRFWPLWLAAWQSAVMVAHLAKLIDPEMRSSGYALQAQLWAYPMLITMAVGAWRHHQRVMAGRDDPSWKSQLT